MKCECCGRQIVNRAESTQYTAPGLHPKAGFNGNGFCDECGAQLDENGLFPEERELAVYLTRMLQC